MVKDFISNIFKRNKNKSELPQLEENKNVPQDYGPREIVVHYDPVGSSGTEIYSGYISEDYLDGMRGTERADKYDQMRRSDPDVKMCLSAVKNSIMNGTWEVEAGEDTEEAKADAEFIKHILFHDLNKPFLDILEEGMTVCEFGHSVFEITHRPVLDHPDHGSFISVNLNWRSPRTIERWNVDKKSERLISISQYAYGDLDKLVDIPGEFLIVMTLQKEGANYEGISLLRPCYGPYIRRNNYLKLNASGIEKFAVPTPIATVPDGKQGTEQFRRLELILQAYTYHQKNYIMKPAGWDLELNTGNTYDPSKVETSIDNEGQRMTRSFMANFLTLGMNTVGSYALSNDLSDFFFGGIEHVAGKFTTKINLLIVHLILLNKGPRKVYPILKCSGISDKAGLEFAQIITLLTGQKVIIADDKLEDHVRKRMKLPERSEDGQRSNAPAPQFSPEEKKKDETLAERIRRVNLKGSLWAKK